MDKEFEIKLSSQAAENLIPCLSKRIEALDADIDGKEEELAWLIRQRDATKITLAEIKAKLDGGKPAIKNGKFQKRLPKGYAEKLIVEVLTALPPGQALTMAQIEEKTGVNHTSVFRVLTEKKRNNGRFIGSQGRWYLNGRLPPRPLRPACCSVPIESKTDAPPAEEPAKAE